MKTASLDIRLSPDGRVAARQVFFARSLQEELPIKRELGDADPRSERVRLPAMFQCWCDLTFLHWRYPPESVRPHLPPALELDTFDGSAWVGITPFLLRNLRPPLLPSLPWISHFPETNCRTYVRGLDGRRGVWFFSLDAARLAAVGGARFAYGLPYAWSRMRVARRRNQIVYESARRWPDIHAGTRFVVEPGEAAIEQPLEAFLTARFRLYSYVFGSLTFSRVEHPPWPLQTARLMEARQTLTKAAALPDPEGAPIVHFSRGVCVRVGFPERVR